LQARVGIGALKLESDVNQNVEIALLMKALSGMRAPLDIEFLSIEKTATIMLVWLVRPFALNVWPTTTFSAI
jgi:hypothetical protein